MTAIEEDVSADHLRRVGSNTQIPIAVTVHQNQLATIGEGFDSSMAPLAWGHGAIESEWFSLRHRDGGQLFV